MTRSAEKAEMRTALLRHQKFPGNPGACTLDAMAAGALRPELPGSKKNCRCSCSKLHLWLVKSPPTRICINSLQPVIQNLKRKNPESVLKAPNRYLLVNVATPFCWLISPWFFYVVNRKRLELKTARVAPVSPSHSRRRVELPSQAMWVPNWPRKHGFVISSGKNLPFPSISCGICRPPSSHPPDIIIHIFVSTWVVLMSTPGHCTLAIWLRDLSWSLVADPWRQTPRSQNTPDPRSTPCISSSSNSVLAKCNNVHLPLSRNM